LSGFYPYNAIFKAENGNARKALPAWFQRGLLELTYMPINDRFFYQVSADDRIKDSL
jgi:hypothetical protein